MQPVATRPKRHLFVCTNRRAPGDPLGSGCSERGDAVYAALKDEVARRAVHRQVWVTRTHCLGICPKRGATAAVYAADGSAPDPILTEVEPTDAADLVEGRR